METKKSKTTKKVKSVKKAAPRKAAKRKPVEAAPKPNKVERTEKSLPKTALPKTRDDILKMIKDLDTIEVTRADLVDKQQEMFKKLREALGDAGFEHPERGSMCVMQRNGLYFWRARPTGK